MKASKTSLNCNKIGNLSMTLVLDKRTNKNTEKYPMAICFNIDRTRWYYKLVDMPFQTETFFNSVCSVSSSRSRLMDIHDQWQQLLEGYREKVVKLSKSRPITLDNIKTMLSGAGFEEENDFSFLGVWEGLINKYKRENRVGTADNYSWSLNSFRKIIGEVNGFTGACISGPVVSYGTSASSEAISPKKVTRFQIRTTISFLYREGRSGSSRI